MFQANYKDTQMPLTEAVPVLFFLPLPLNIFLFAGVISEGTTQKNSEK